jgi:hypothetical protein
MSFCQRTAEADDPIARAATFANGGKAMADDLPSDTKE